MVAVEEIWSNVSRAAAATTAAAVTASECLIQEVSSEEVWSDLAFCHDCVVVPCTSVREPVPRTISFQPRTKKTGDSSCEQKLDFEIDNDTVSDFESLLFCASSRVGADIDVNACAGDSISEILSSPPTHRTSSSFSNKVVNVKKPMDVSDSSGAVTDMYKGPLLDVEEEKEIPPWEDDEKLVSQQTQFPLYESSAPYDEQADRRDYTEGTEMTTSMRLETMASF